ncbi:MAG: hypothetical protein MK089_12910 [Phycisphaerales bacterium]|nr:hypothetical protein [Phycisphaerales bacterium]
MTIKAKTHTLTYFIAWTLLLVAAGFWFVFFLVEGGHIAQYMWWPSFLTATISSILFGMILFKGLFD